jgi:hypothetical protein
MRPVNESNAISLRRAARRSSISRAILIIARSAYTTAAGKVEAARGDDNIPRCERR